MTHAQDWRCRVKETLNCILFSRMLTMPLITMMLMTRFQFCNDQKLRQIWQQTSFLMSWIWERSFLIKDLISLTLTMINTSEMTMKSCCQEAGTSWETGWRRRADPWSWSRATEPWGWPTSCQLSWDSGCQNLKYFPSSQQTNADYPGITWEIFAARNNHQQRQWKKIF